MYSTALTVITLALAPIAAVIGAGIALLAFVGALELTALASGDSLGGALFARAFATFF